MNIVGLHVYMYFLCVIIFAYLKYMETGIEMRFEMLYFTLSFDLIRVVSNIQCKNVVILKAVIIFPSVSIIYLLY